jgi:dTDP-4-dehydrorhamnose 3,5-epimerase
MKITTIQTEIPGIILIETDFAKDERGFFIEAWNKKTYSEAGLIFDFVQENHSGSKKNTIRGLHYQDISAPLAKLVRCIAGKVFDVAVDLRLNSPTYKKWYSVELDSEKKNQIFIPVGFAHGFCAVSDWAEIEYKQTGYYVPNAEKTIIWNDPDLNIPWPTENPLLSDKDKEGISFKDYEINPSFS